MATSSLLGIDTDNLPSAHSATGIDSLGPSDASDSGSDSAGAYSTESDSDTDRFGTGERASVEPNAPPSARDILPDHVEGSTTARSGGTAPDEGVDSDGRDGSAPLGTDDLSENPNAAEAPEDGEED